MRGAIWMVVRDLHNQSPYASKSGKHTSAWHMPFHQKSGIWRLILRRHAARSIFSEPPKRSLFRRTMALPEFKRVVFHRVVDIGRCPKCEYFEYKCASVPQELRGSWQTAMAEHHLLQIQQKKCYSADRAVAAADYPNSEIWIVT